ncbi:MAG: hypothetical protein J6M31_00085, partial [Bacteroidales bacterium]|nr:hypothetical protein [Bacteroidales bacterium]
TVGLVGSQAGLPEDSASVSASVLASRCAGTGSGATDPAPAGPSPEAPSPGNLSAGPVGPVIMVRQA